MTILNMMLGKKRGGLEQAALDYAEGLAAAGIGALSVIAPAAWVEAPMVAAGVPHQSLPHIARWDPVAAWRLRRLAKRTKATAIICHGNRALTLALMAFKSPLIGQRFTVNGQPITVIAIAHNYQIRRFARADGCLAITQHLANYLAAHGAKNIHLMPNMVRIPELPPRPAFRTPPVIGSMGRFVGKKRFDLFIEALAILKARNIAFTALLGGDGERVDALRALIHNHGLENQVSLTGWVRDKTAFFHATDLFVLPSDHEPFGIVLIEAMAYRVPLVTTDAEGPSEIVHDGVDALLTPRGDAVAMADALEKLIGNAPYATQLATHAHALVTREYSLAAMAGRLKAALAAYISFV
jgi:glycosyltransferase involved in cell wall biosynthesis